MVTKTVVREMKIFSNEEYGDIASKLINFFKQSEYDLTIKREGLIISMFYLTYSHYDRIKIEPLYLKSNPDDIFRIRVSWFSDYHFITVNNCSNERIFEVADDILNKFDASKASQLSRSLDPDDRYSLHHTVWP